MRFLREGARHRPGGAWWVFIQAASVVAALYVLWIGALATIVPDGYTADTIDVTLTYAKAVLTVALSQTTTCLSHDGGVTYDPVANCRKPQVVPCIASRGGTQGGDGVVVLRIDPEDPIGGTYS